jgi:hypothetical protein
MMVDHHPLKGSSKMSPVELGGKTILIDIEVIDAPLDYNILFGRSYMYAMKVVASSVFRMMMFPHNGKIVTIDQITHYEPNHSTNIDNILPLVRTSSDAYSVIDMGPRIFKDPSLLGAYHGAPPLLHPSTQVCVVSSNGTRYQRHYSSHEAPPHIEVPPVGELLPQEFPENPTAPLIPDSPPPPPLQGKIPVWETVPQAITQIPFFYPPPGVQAFQVVATLTLPNMVLSIPVWYLHPPCDGSSTISPSSDRGNTDADPSTGSYHTTLTPNCWHHCHCWGQTKEERAHNSTSSPSSTSLCTMRKRRTPH